MLTADGDQHQQETPCRVPERDFSSQNGNRVRKHQHIPLRLWANTKLQNCVNPTARWCEAFLWSNCRACLVWALGLVQGVGGLGALLTLRGIGRHCQPLHEYAISVELHRFKLQTLRKNFGYHRVQILALSHLPMICGKRLSTYEHTIKQKC